MEFIAVYNILHAARRLSLDYRSRLFWTTGYAYPGTSAHFINTPYHIDNLIPHELYPPILHLGQTGEVPVAIHITGNGNKNLRIEWWGKFWWNKPNDKRFGSILSRRVDGATISIAGGGAVKWRDVCPKDVLGV